jgi:gluconokinase
MIYIVMGVMGAGKTTIGRKLAKKLNCRFYDGDDYHSEFNKEKMSKGIPLTDKDRGPWIFAIRAIIDLELALKENAVITCSALKDRYRKTLMQARKDITLIYLKADIKTVENRLKHRKGGFANPSLLKSQFETLEEPSDAIVADVRYSPEYVVKYIIKLLDKRGR